MTTEGFVRRPRPPRPRLPGGELAVAPPPEIPRNIPASIVTRLLPLVMVVAMVGMMALFFTAGSAALRNPVTLLFPMMMLMSMVGMFATGGGRGGGQRPAELNEERKDYLRYLGRTRAEVEETSRNQLAALLWSHPEPGSLLPAVGSRRMWERRADDNDFCHVRLGIGAQRLATRLAPPETGPLEDLEPVSMMALRRFVRMHSVVRGLPTAISLRAFPAVNLEGETAPVADLVRSMLLQLCTFHGPDLTRVAIICADPDGEWSWAKWLPHVGHPERRDGVGRARMLYQSLREFESDHELDLQERPRFSRNATPVAGRAQWFVVIADGYVAGDERTINDGGLDSVTVLDLTAPKFGLAARKGTQLVVDGPSVGAKSAFGVENFAVHDRVSVPMAEAVARRMARYSLATAAQLVNLEPDSGPRDPGLMRLLHIGDAATIEPDTVWRARSSRERLRVPVGVTQDGQPLEIDIKEAAENGMGPHGLCIGATGSGKSEFLRTLVLSMVTTHSPDSLNLVLVDFKGGATFLGLDDLPHVAAVITNLEDELAMVDRMRDALAGEMNRRQEVLRASGNFANVAEYEKARVNGAPLPPLPALFIVVDEFSELLAQKPDFAELFVMIGRLGRSLQMHLLLASQRLEEGKLRGLDSHLSYRIGLKTFSASESRTVLGVPDAYHLPAIPGSAYLKCDSSDPVRFNASYVSGPYVATRAARTRRGTTGRGPVVPVRPFSAGAVAEIAAPPVVLEDPIDPPDESAGPIIRDGRTVTELDMVVSRLEGHGRAAHEVWLPPLEESTPAGQLVPVRDWRAAPSRDHAALRIPIGVVDRPYDQRRDILHVDLAGAQGHAAIIGGPQSGKSTALRTLILAASITHTPLQVQFYCLDFGGGTLAALAGLPHVGSVATRLEEDRVRRTVAEVMTVLRRRESLFRELGIDSMQEFRRRRAAGDDRLDVDRFGDVFLVVDGWSTIRTEYEAIEDQFNAIATQGLAFGVHLVLGASRWMEIRPVVKDLLGTRVELRLGDPADSEVDRKVAATVPIGRPGRGLSPDKLHMLIGIPRLDRSSSTDDLSVGVAAAVDEVAAFYPDSAAPEVRMLPERIDRDELLAAAYRTRERRSSEVVVGLAEADLAPVTIDFAAQPHFLAFADGESGKTNLVRTIVRGLTENGPPADNKIVLVDYRRTLLGEVEGNHLAAYATSAQALAPLVDEIVTLMNARAPGPDVTPAQLRDRSWWSGPDFYIVVDDYDMVAVATGNPLLPLLELLSQARDIGLHLIIARRSGGASRAMFDPILARLRDLTTDGFVGSASKDVVCCSGRPSARPAHPGAACSSRGAERVSRRSPGRRPRTDVPQN